jgi:hypothetical protein
MVKGMLREETANGEEGEYIGENGGTSNDGLSAYFVGRFRRLTLA